MKKTMFRTSLIVVLLLALVGLTVSSFAYWDRLSKDDGRTVTIGQGAELSINEVVDTTNTLVPVGKVLEENDVEEVVYTYTVKLNKQAVNDLKLTVAVTDITIGGVDTYNHLVNIDIVPEVSTVNQAGTQVVVTITLNEPANEIEYEAVANKTIAFTISFSASQE